MPRAEHLISYHILIDGRCYGGLLGEEQVELVAGDVLVFPHGDAHTCLHAILEDLSNEKRDIENQKERRPIEQLPWKHVDDRDAGTDQIQQFLDDCEREKHDGHRQKDGRLEDLIAPVFHDRAAPVRVHEVLGQRSARHGGGKYRGHGPMAGSCNEAALDS